MPVFAVPGVVGLNDAVCPAMLVPENRLTLCGAGVVGDLSKEERASTSLESPVSPANWLEAYEAAPLVLARDFAVRQARAMAALWLIIELSPAAPQKSHYVGKIMLFD
jgi:hypothetical protein